MTRSGGTPYLGFRKHRWFRLLSSIRFAIPALFLFVAAMIYGTLMESTYGASYAKRAVYQSIPYTLLQLGILASVIAAVVDRIPLKKRLAGFYTVHAALVILMVGAAMTRYWGVDGTVELNAASSVNQARLDEDRLYAQLGGRTASLSLPDVAGPRVLGSVLKVDSTIWLRVVNYLPWATERTRWVQSDSGAWFSEWQLKGPRGEQSLQLGSEDRAGYRSSLSMGPLHVEWVPMARLDALRSGARYALVNIKGGKSFAFKDLSAQPQVRKRVNAKLGLEFIEFTTEGRVLQFFPRFSSLPVTAHQQVDSESPWRFYDAEALSASGPQVLLARSAGGAIRVAYGKGGKWEFRDYQGERISLPWMGFGLTLVADHAGQVPVVEYVPTLPSAQEESPPPKAALIEVHNGVVTEQLWAHSLAPVQAPLTGIELFLGSRMEPLPFSLKLNRFKMDTVPGTDRPASYESFVQVTEPSAPPREEHIYMNHPLKSGGYTFYQSSYLQDEMGEYHSILSVNRDPGRAVKYAGALLLVVGLLLHYLILNRVIEVRT